MKNCIQHHKGLARIILLIVLAMSMLGCSSAGNVASSETAPTRFVVPAQLDLEGMQNSFRSVVQAVLPAVVRIDVVEIRNTQSPGEGNNNPFFDFFFNPQNPEGEREFRSEGLGSGVIVRRNNNAYYVLTNAHVIGEAEEITVRLDDGRDFIGKLIGKDVRKDLALVEFSSKDPDIVIAGLGDSDSLQVGDWVLAIGSPLGFQSTVTAGIVSALGRDGGPEGNISDFIQTDAAINRGNSGGALVNIYGEVVGINTWISSNSGTGGNIGLGFSVPINNAKKAIDDFITQGVVEYGWLGVSIISINEEVAKSLNLTITEGALVNSIYGRSPAGRSDMRPGDFITSINNKPIDSADEIVRTVGDLAVGNKAQFKVLRNGQPLSFDVKIIARESEDIIAGQSLDLFPGFTVYPLTPEVKEQIPTAEDLSGVLISQIVPRSLGAVAGVAVGDIITEANGTKVRSMSDFFTALALNNKALELSYNREGVQMSITIEKK